MNELEKVAARTTHAVLFNPNCPSPYEVRLPRGYMDFKRAGETRDFVGYGKTFNEAFAAALRAHQQGEGR